METAHATQPVKTAKTAMEQHAPLLPKPAHATKTVKTAKMLMEKHAPKLLSKDAPVLMVSALKTEPLSQLADHLDF